MRHYVVYLRVSPEDGGRPGRDLPAQERDLEIFLKTIAPRPCRVIGRFTEMETMVGGERPQLEAALAMARKVPGAELLVARLDRLSSDMDFVASLIRDRKVRLRVAAAGRPEPSHLPIFAAIAEQERRSVSSRTREALAEAKARGAKLGGLRDTTAKRNAALQAQARERALKIEPIVRSMREQGVSLENIAVHLNQAGVKPAQGETWRGAQVRRVLQRLDALVQERERSEA